MSSYNDINQLLKEIGTSDRSAGDPWTISRSYQATVKRNSFSPAVVADLGAPAQDLTSEIQSSEQIARADEVATSPTGSSASGSGTSSTGSGILGGFLSLFPLASVVGKLFGLGGSSSPSPLTPYIQPPSISFEGALPGSLSSSTSSSLLGSSSGSSSGFAPGVNSLSYGANGLPRTSAKEIPSHAIAPNEMPETTMAQSDAISRPERSNDSSLNVAEHLTNRTSSAFTSEPVVDSPAVNSLTAPDFAPEPAMGSPVLADAVSQPDTPEDSSPDVTGQLRGLTSSNFKAEPAEDSPVPSADLMATTAVRGPGSSSSRSSTGGNGGTPPGSDTSASTSQQGQSILVQVQAMDSQSFMDHSNDIAQAVRQAMLNLHSVNDVISGL